MKVFENTHLYTYSWKRLSNVFDIRFIILIHIDGSKNVSFSYIVRLNRN